MIVEFLKYSFIQNALISSMLASIVCGIVGTIIVEKKLVSMSGGIAHASFGGIGLGYLLGIEPLIGGLLFSVMASLGVSCIKRQTNTNADALIGIFWAVGMALGILFISLMSGYPPDMPSYLFGDILTVSTKLIKLMILLSVIIVFFIVGLFNYWKLYMFDEEFGKVLKINVVTLERVLFILISLSIVVLIKVVGIILVIALLTIPPAVAKLFTYDIKKIMVLSILIGTVFSISGLILSCRFDIPSGATVILLSAIGYFISAITVKIIKT